MNINNKTLAFLYTLKKLHPHTYHHSINVAKYSMILGQKIGLDNTELEKLKIAGVLHDIGKLKIPEAILHKPGKFTDEEYQIIKMHPEYGVTLLREAGFEDEEIIKIIEAHHEKIDGTGYPNNLNGQQIPFLSKIISIGDSYDAMTSNRCYREKQDNYYVRRQFVEGAGKQFDLRLCTLFLEFLDEECFKYNATKNNEFAKVNFDLEI